MVQNKRQIVAIMFTDMVGYSAISQKNEEKALELLSIHNTILRPFFNPHNGTVIKTIGDAFLAEFSSVTDAVKCSLSIQHALKKYCNEASQDDQIVIRIGIHMGEVLHQENDIFGDGVNLAARIEPLANPGGICISRQVYDQVRGKVNALLVTAGTFELKNIIEPQELYRVLLPWQNADDANISNSVYHIGQSIAVLPFANMSKDKDQEYFCDGITEELLSRLTRIEGLKVVARASSFAFKNKKVSIAQIAKTLNVKTILEGSVRKSGDHIRVTIQLINARDGYNLFSGAYDGTDKDIFTIQDKISVAIVSSLKVKLLGGDKIQLARHHTQNPEAHALYLQGKFYWNMRQYRPFKKAMNFYRQAIDKDPGYARPYIGIAETLSMLGTYGFLAPREVYPRAKEVAKRALSIDNSLGEAHISLAWINSVFEYHWQEADLKFQQGIGLAPNYATGYTLHGMCLLMRTKFKQAAAAMDRAHELDPLSVIITADQGLIASFSQDYDTGINFLNQALEMHKKFYLAYTWLGMAHMGQGNIQAAINVFHTQLKEEGKTPLALGHLGLAYGLAGKHVAARQILAQFQKIKKTKRYVSPYCQGIIHLGLEEMDNAFACFNIALKERDTSLNYLYGFPRMLPQQQVLTHDPRYTILLQKMNLHDDIHLTT